VLEATLLHHAHKLTDSCRQSESLCENDVQKYHAELAHWQLDMKAKCVIAKNWTDVIILQPLCSAVGKNL